MSSSKQNNEEILKALLKTQKIRLKMKIRKIHNFVQNDSML